MLNKDGHRQFPSSVTLTGSRKWRVCNALPCFFYPTSIERVMYVSRLSYLLWSYRSYKSVQVVRASSIPVPPTAIAFDSDLMSVIPPIVLNTARGSPLYIIDTSKHSHPNKSLGIPLSVLHTGNGGRATLLGDNKDHGRPPYNCWRLPSSIKHPWPFLQKNTQ